MPSSPEIKISPISLSKISLNGYKAEVGRQLSFTSNGKNQFEATDVSLATITPDKLLISNIQELGRAENMPVEIFNGLSDTQIGEESRTVHINKTLARDSQTGEVIEDPTIMRKRVAWNLGTAELVYGGSMEDAIYRSREFYEIMQSHKFLPNSPTLTNAGKPLQQLAACFVLPWEDSMDGIFETVKHMALIQKSGGGTGFSGARLRPEGDIVATTGREASGPISFWENLDKATESVKQGGVRRGANMMILPIHHPDIMKFIAVKDEDRSKFTNFNNSVALTDEFMEAVINKRHFYLKSPRTGEVWIWRSGPNKGKPAKLYAPAVFKEIAQRAWRCGDPGGVFIDRINNGISIEVNGKTVIKGANPTPALGEIEATNPCGEQPLLPYEACNLGSINLGVFVKEEVVSQDFRERINEQGLRRVCQTATRLEDNVVTMSEYPIPEITEMVAKTRKIGIGVMGFADLLIKLDVPYDSDEAVEVADYVMSIIEEETDDASKELAKERGVFPAWEGSIYDPNSPYFAGEARKLRNSTRRTVAPTGTIALLANWCSQGLEPLYAIAYQRRMIKTDGSIEMILVFDPLFEKVVRERGFYSEELMQKIIENHGSVQGIPEIPKDVQKIFKTAHDVHYSWHLKIQEVVQRHTDNAVSKTINMPNSAKDKDVFNAYMMAYKLGLKGITVYRDGSRDVQVLSAIEKEETEKKPVLIEREVELPPTIKKAQRSNTYRVETADTPVYITITDELYASEDGVRLQWFPRQDFQARLPNGDPVSIQFASQGVDRTHIIKSENPDYEQLVRNWLSTETSKQWQLPGNPDTKVTSFDNAVGQVFLYHLIGTGAFDIDEQKNGHPAKWHQVVWKKDFRVVPLEKFKELRDTGVINGHKEVIDVKVEKRIPEQSASCPVCGGTSNVDPHGSSCGGIVCSTCGYEDCG